MGEGRQVSYVYVSIRKRTQLKVYRDEVSYLAMSCFLSLACI